MLDKNLSSKVVLSFAIFILSISFVSAVDLTQYEDIGNITVACQEYRGYASVSVPSYRTYYMNETFFIQESQTTLEKQANWYNLLFEDIDISSSELLLDGKFSSYATFSGNSAKIRLKNIKSQQIDRISIDVADSEIDSLTINGNRVSLTGYAFHYDIDTNILADELEFVFTYRNVLKIREISLFTKDERPQSQLYFFVNNDCDRVRKIYLGDFGTSNQQYGAQSMPVVFSTNLVISNNDVYQPDFDGDEILNSIDNCPFVANFDQKDINYNLIGDVCEDWDGDGVLNHIDNCPELYNPAQSDMDKDGLGDACDLEDERLFENPVVVWPILILSAVIIIGLALLLNKKK